MKHPDYDIDFKPAIARYDWDQTYDVLEFVRLPQGFDGLMQQLGIPAFELMAIDRFTPYRYIWAEQYSDYVYNFLKQFNFSPDSSILSRLALRADDNPLLQLFTSFQFKDKYTIDGVTFYSVGDIVVWWGDFYQCVSSHTSFYNNLNRSAYWKQLTFRAYAWNDTRLRKFDYIKLVIDGETRYFVANFDNSFIDFPVNSSYWTEISLTIPLFVFTGDKYSNTAQYPLQLTAGDYCLTFLVEQGQQTGLIGSITTINQVHRQFSLAEATTIDLNQLINGTVGDDYALDAYHQDTGQKVPQQHPQAVITYNGASRFCVNSLVLSKQVNGTWQQQTVSSPNKFLFYSDIADYFTEVSDALMQYFEDTYDTYHQIYNNYCTSVVKPQQYYDYELLSLPTADNLYNNEYKKIIFHSFPTHFVDKCYLQRANNAKWSSSNSALLDLGYPITTESLSVLMGLPFSYAKEKGYTFQYMYQSMYRNEGDKYSQTATSNLVGDHLYPFGKYLFDYPCYEDFYEEIYDLNANNHGGSGGEEILFPYSILPTVTNPIERLLHPSIKYYSNAHERPASFYEIADNFYNSCSPFNLVRPSFFVKVATVGVNGNALDMTVTSRSYVTNNGIKYERIYGSNCKLYITGTVDYTYYEEATANLSVVVAEKSNSVTDYIRGGSSEGIVIEDNSTVNYSADYFSDKTVNIIYTLFSEGDITTILQNKQSINDYLNYLLQTKATLERYMVDSVRIKEIHACLGAGEFSYYTNAQGNPQPYYMSMARLLTRFARAYGVAFNPDGSIMSVRQSKGIPQGIDIPVGWNFAQFGSNQGDGKPHNETDYSGQNGGDPSEERVGIVYQVKSNQLITNDATGEPIEIREGGYILCESLPQYLAVLERDLDKALDWQNLGAGLVNFNGKTLVVEGLFSFLQEICVVDADTNMTTEQTRISSLITQQLAKEILKAFGLPTQVKKFDFTLQSNDQTWQGVMGNTEITGEVPYNAIAEQSPTIATLLLTILENIAIGNIGKLQLNDEEALKQTPPTELDQNIVPTKEDLLNNAIQILQNWGKQSTVEKK